MAFLSKAIESVKAGQENEGDRDEMEIERDAESGEEEEPGKQGNRNVGEARELVQVDD